MNGDNVATVFVPHRIVTSLEVRGKQPEEMTKLMLCDLLHRDIMLEKRVLGERAHRRIHELEEEIRELKKVKKLALPYFPSVIKYLKV